MQANPEYEPISYSKYVYKTEPYQHQRSVLQRCWMRPYYAWFLTMGLGKSKIAIDNFSCLFQHNLIDGVLIIAPKGVYRNWTSKEIPQHMPDHLQRRMMYWSTKKKDFNAIEKMADVGPLPEMVLDILVVNIDALIMKRNEEILTRFLETHRAMIIVDESTRIKNPSAKRTKAAIRLAKKAKYRRILTGSPILNSPLDLYSQCDFLSPAVTNTRARIYQDNPLGFSNFYSFRARYAIMKKATFGGITREFPVAYKSLDELGERLKGFSSRITKEECLDLPDKIYLTREVPLSDDQRKYYNEMAKKSRVLLEGLDHEEDPIYAKIALTQLLKLHQISTGFISTDDGHVVKIDSNRSKELLALVDELDLNSGKVIVWSNFVSAIEEVIEVLSEKFGPESVVHFYGATSDEDREKAKVEFQDPKSPVKFFVGNPSSAGMGITLTQATTVIYYSNSFSLEHRLQSEDRAHRVGQTKNVTYIDFVSTPLDRDVIDALKNKKNISDVVIDGGVSRWMEVKADEQLS